MGQRDRMFKVLVVGDATVGKTSLVQRYANDSFNRHYKSTVGGEPWRSRGFPGLLRVPCGFPAAPPGSGPGPGPLSIPSPAPRSALPGALRTAPLSPAPPRAVGLGIWDGNSRASSVVDGASVRRVSFLSPRGILSLCPAHSGCPVLSHPLE